MSEHNSSRESSAGVLSAGSGGENVNMSHDGSVAHRPSLEVSPVGNRRDPHMVGDFERAVRAHGDRGYRYVHFEAGAIGHRLHLAAEALGLAATSPNQACFRDLGASRSSSAHMWVLSAFSSEYSSWDEAMALWQRRHIESLVPS